MSTLLLVVTLGGYVTACSSTERGGGEARRAAANACTAEARTLARVYPKSPRGQAIRPVLAAISTAQRDADRALARIEWPASEAAVAKMALRADRRVARSIRSALIAVTHGADPAIVRPGSSFARRLAAAQTRAQVLWRKLGVSACARVDDPGHAG